MVFFQIVFHFASGIESSLSNDLKNLGVSVSGDVLDPHGLPIVEESSTSLADERY
jgi:hypothetical protein